MDTATKQQVKTDLVAHLRAQLAGSGAQEQVEGRQALADLGERRVDQDSQEDEAGAMHEHFGKVDAQQRLDLKEAEALDMAARSTVEPGAIVTIDGEHYVVGVPSDSFTSGGRSYTGLATNAPIYDAVKGLQAGATFTFGGREQHVDAIA